VILVLVMGDVRNGRNESGFTKIDLLVVVFILCSIVALLGIYLPTMPKRKDKLPCSFNLQYIGQNSRYYANFNDNKFYISVASNFDIHAPSIEQVYSQAVGSRLPVSYLICPQDLRKSASDWKTLKATNISYFFNTDAVFNDPSSILAGDRNVAVSTKGAFSWNSALGMHGAAGIYFSPTATFNKMSVPTALTSFFMREGTPQTGYFSHRRPPPSPCRCPRYL
jgi:hypothetical protein